MTLQPVAALPVDADLWWTVYLRGALVGRDETYAQNVYVDRSVPSERRDRMVLVRRDGGSVTGLFDRPRISFDVWAKTEQDATNLANLVVALALVAPLSAAGVTKVAHLSGPNSVPDESKQPRRLCLIEATTAPARGDLGVLMAYKLTHPASDLEIEARRLGGRHVRVAGLGDQPERQAAHGGRRQEVAPPPPAVRAGTSPAASAAHHPSKGANSWH
jgi:hypothetical protein